MSNFNIVFLSLLTYITSSALNAESPCVSLTLTKDTSLEKLINHCDLQKELAKDPVVIKNQRSLLHSKLANKLAVQITQTSEELAILTNFYHNNGKDLGMNNQDINNKCKLETIKDSIKCKNDKSNVSYDEKLNLLKSFLPSNKNTQFVDDQSLFGLVAGKFSNDLGLSNLNNQKQCPLSEDGGAFLLKGQLDEMSAKDIVNSLNSSTGLSEKAIFNDYAQLKIISDSKDPELMKAFKEYIKKIPSDANAKRYLSDFFIKPNYQPKLSNIIAEKCDKTLSNIKTFMCKELNELASLDNNVSINIFNKLNTKKPLENQYNVKLDEPGVLTAYGMQCLAKEKNLSSNDTLSNNLSLDKWFTDFTAQTRETSSNASNIQDVKLFCSVYNCESENVKHTPSCTTGGPLTSQNIKDIYKCNYNPRHDDCTQQILKYSDLLENIESIKKNALGEFTKDKVKNNLNVPSNSIKRLPSFAENFFGAEGTLKVLGIETSPKIIAEKRLEIENKSREATNTSLSIAEHKQTIKPEQIQNSNNTDSSVQVNSAMQTADRIASAPTYARAIAPNSKSAVNSNNYKVQPTPAASTESTRLRREMEDMLKDLKSNPNLASANSDSDTNDSSSITSRSDSSTPKKLASGTTIKSRAEEERLERYAKQLDQRERDLNDYKDKLDNQAYSRTVSDDSTGSQKSLLPKSGIAGAGEVSDTAGSNSSSSGSSSSGSTGSSSLKLSAANPKAEQKTNTAAIIQSGKETSTLSVEELTTLSPDNLQNLGIDSTKPFTLRVNFKAKTYEVPVKTLLYKGRNILGPVIDPKNIDLKDMLLKTPLFRPFQEYRLEREKQVL